MLKITRLLGLGTAFLLVAAPAARRFAARRLARRVRRRVAPLLSRPQELEVKAEGNRVVLSGPVRPLEVDSLLATVWRIGGVRAVDVRLELSDEPDAPHDMAVAAVPRQRPHFPAFRMMAVLTAGGLLAYGLRHRGWLRALFS